MSASRGRPPRTAPGILGDLGRNLEHLIEVLWRLDTDLVEDLSIVGDVVQLVAPRDAPLLGFARAELGPGDAIPRGRRTQTGEHILPVEGRIRLRRVLDVGIE